MGLTRRTLTRSYSAGFQIILGMEERLPVRVYAEEKDIYRNIHASASGTDARR